MNNLNEDDEDTSTRVHKFIRSIVAYGAERTFLAGSYRCPVNDGESAALHSFLGIDITRSNIQIKLARRLEHPKPGLIHQEVSRICNANHIATQMMQSFIFPLEIVQEMNAIDHCDNREITTSALYTSIKAVITLMNRLNGSIIEAGVMHDVSVASVCVAIINMNPMPNTNELEIPAEYQEYFFPHHKDSQPSHINSH